MILEVCQGNFGDFCVCLDYVNTAQMRLRILPDLFRQKKLSSDALADLCSNALKIARTEVRAIP